MQPVGAGLDHHADVRAAVAAEVRRPIGHDGDLVDGIEWQQPVSPTLAPGWRIEERVVVVGAVDLEVIVDVA